METTVAYWDACAFVLLDNRNWLSVSPGTDLRSGECEDIAGLLRRAAPLNPAGLARRVPN
jgi:hypothetical protein